jgi:hypothetical protein
MLTGHRVSPKMSNGRLRDMLQLFSGWSFWALGLHQLLVFKHQRLLVLVYEPARNLTRPCSERRQLLSTRTLSHIVSSIVPAVGSPLNNDADEVPSSPGS